MNNPEISGRTPIRILLLESSELLVEGLKNTVGSFPGLHLFQVCKDIESTRKSLDHFKTDILIVSFLHSAGDQFRYLESVRATYPRMRVIALVAALTPEQGTRLLANGVNGIICLADSSTTIIQTILNVHENVNCLDISMIGMHSEGTSASQSKNGDSFNLMDHTTNREREILRLLASGCSSIEIGKILFISNHTVNTHRKNLMQKAGAKNSAQLIQMAYSSGILSGAHN